MFTCCSLIVVEVEGTSRSEAITLSRLACRACRWNSRNRGPVEHKRTVNRHPLRYTYLDAFGIKTKSFLLVGEEVLNILALITLELNNFSHFGVCYDGSIAGELLLDHLEDLLLVEFLGESLDCGQGLASIALCKRWL